MNLLKTVFVVAIVTMLLFACHKKDRPVEEPKTDELSNKAWGGVYGRHRIYKPGDIAPMDVYDTLVVLGMKNNGFFNVYRTRDTAKSGIEGEGHYTYDGVAFKATFTLFNVGNPYTMEGKINDERTFIIGSLKYNNTSTNGIFRINIGEPFNY